MLTWRTPFEQVSIGSCGRASGGRAANSPATGGSRRTDAPGQTERRVLAL